jgi:hypothetical protein
MCMCLPCVSSKLIRCWQSVDSDKIVCHLCMLSYSQCIFLIDLEIPLHLPEFESEYFNSCIHPQGTGFPSKYLDGQVRVQTVARMEIENLNKA